MARSKGSGGLALMIAACVFSLITIALTVLVFIAGVKPGVLDGIALFKIDTKDLQIPSKLSSSSFLKDLEHVSGGDLTGSSATASSLGLADTYTIHVLTVCSKRGSATACTSPKIGGWFNPRKTLRLDGSGLSGKYSDGFNNALSAYKDASYFIGIGLIIAVVLAALPPVAAGVSGRVGALGTFAATVSWLATGLLIADAVASLVVSRGMVNALHDDLGKLGLKSSLGKSAHITFSAFVASFIASILYSGIARRSGFTSSTRPKFSSAARVVGGGEGLSDIDRDAKDAKGPGGIFQRAATWSRHRYVQVERQPEVKVLKTPGYEQAEMMDPADEHQDGNTIDYRNPAAERDIAMVPLSNSGQRLDLVYEPYTSQTVRTPSPAHSDHGAHQRYDDGPR